VEGDVGGERAADSRPRPVAGIATQPDDLRAGPTTAGVVDGTAKAGRAEVADLGAAAPKGCRFCVGSCDRGRSARSVFVTQVGSSWVRERKPTPRKIDTILYFEVVTSRTTVPAFPLLVRFAFPRFALADFLTTIFPPAAVKARTS
jgi:hypothetical protein